MKSITARLQELETVQTSLPSISKEQSNARLLARATERGLTKADVGAQYGGLPGFAYALMMESRPAPQAWADDGLSAQERYMRMLAKSP
jgi:hypothetical protein